MGGIKDMKIKTRTFSFDLDTTDGITSYNIYYGLATEELTYESTKINFPIINGQLTYTHIIPTEIPVGEGLVELGVTTQDAEGNESDIIPLEYQFDFTAPTQAKNLRIG